MKATEIEWIGNKNLPTEVDLPDDYNVFEIYDWLVDKYHCDIDSYCILCKNGSVNVIMIEET